MPYERSGVPNKIIQGSIKEISLYKFFATARVLQIPLDNFMAMLQEVCHRTEVALREATGPQPVKETSFFQCNMVGTLAWQADQLENDPLVLSCINTQTGIVVARYVRGYTNNHIF
jgi:hypothetical protein